MQCKNVKQQINDYLDNNLSASDRDEFELHIEACTTCHAELHVMKSLLADLCTLPSRVPRVGFEKRVLGFLDKRPATSWFKHWLAAGVGGAVAAVLMVNLWFGGQHMPGASDVDLFSVALTQGEARRVALVFNSPHSMPQTHLQLQLPEGVEVVGRRGERSLESLVSLEAGRNRLALPLVLRYGIGGELVAILNDGQDSKSFRVKLIAGSHSNTPATVDGKNFF